MSKFSDYVGSQFRSPRGLIGRFCCFMMNRMNHEMYRCILTSLRLPEQARALDVGFGNGKLIQQMHRSFPAELYGVDLSKDMLALAAARNREAVDQGAVRLTVGDCCSLPFDDRFFDAVVSINTIYFWSDVEQGLSEILRVLKPGCVFYNVVYAKEWLQTLSYTEKGFQLFEESDYSALGKTVGFSAVTVREIRKGKSYLIQYIK